MMALTQPFHMVCVASSDAPLEFAVSEAAPPPVKQFTFNVVVDKTLPAGEITAAGEEMKKLRGATQTRPMFKGQIVTVKFDAAAIGGPEAMDLLKAVKGVTSVEADGPL